MSLSEKTIKYINKNCNISLSGKRILITGANSGVGFKTAETALYLGAAVYLACRNSEKALAAKKELLRDYPNGKIEILSLDLASFSSIDEFIDNLPDVDVFVNNAGLIHHPGEKTKDGFELIMGTNYIGLYYLSEKLLPKLLNCGREIVYINTISIAHKIASIDFNHFYDDRGAYSRSKLCIARYTESLAEKYEKTNIHIYMNHPGMAVTPIASHFLGKLYSLQKFAPINSAEKSSLSVIYILSHDIPEGSIVGPNKLFGGWGYPEINRKYGKVCRGLVELTEFTKHELDSI